MNVLFQNVKKKKQTKNTKNLILFCVNLNIIFQGIFLNMKID